MPIDVDVQNSLLLRSFWLHVVCKRVSAFWSTCTLCSYLALGRTVVTTMCT